MGSFILHRNAYLDGDIQTAESQLFKVSVLPPLIKIPPYQLALTTISWHYSNSLSLERTLGQIPIRTTPLAARSR